MEYGLTQGISFALPGDQPIFLDRNKGRYFGLKPALARAFLALATGDREVSVDTVASLERRGVITSGTPAGGIVPFSWRPLRSSLMETDLARTASPGGVAATTLAMIRARKNLRELSFNDNLSRLAERKPHLAVRDAGVLAAASAEFIACRRYVPLRPVCLLDSIGLLEFLAARQCAADLVVGVGAKPFAAHCWVQQGEQALNETLLRVAGLAPIAAA